MIPIISYVSMEFGFIEVVTPLLLLFLLLFFLIKKRKWKISIIVIISAVAYTFSVFFAYKILPIIA